MTEQLPVWNAEGVEPTTELKKNGWQPGMKPSAQHMNWLFNRTYRILEELQNTKVDKINGKGLSTNDYTTAEKNKLADLTITAGQLRNDIGTMGELTTTNKSSLVNAVNEVKNIVEEIDDSQNEIKDNIENINDNLLNTALKLTSINLNIIDMAVELETLKSATLNGVTANIFVETFQNLDDINLTNGIYDSANKRLVL